jgi:DNA-binding NtrC family response regulator
MPCPLRPSPHPQLPNFPPVSEPALSNKRAVVIVDDEKSYVELTSQMISETLGCPVHGFTKPTEALAALPNLGAAVIVTDYFMPKIDGLEFVRRAVTIAPEASIILITAHLFEVSEYNLDGLTGIKGYLQKPFGWRRLAEEVLRVWPGPDKPVSRVEIAPL